MWSQEACALPAYHWFLFMSKAPSMMVTIHVHDIESETRPCRDGAEMVRGMIKLAIGTVSRLARRQIARQPDGRRV